uniref:Uncharacterized protein n=1 Tax=Oryza sativa subsp. japonica TaxID=39947 RepID=Q6ZKG8_ORYSJ|nr:hypothetical protein [Oryza sativa Japonica Group]
MRSPELEDSAGSSEDSNAKRTTMRTHRCKEQRRTTTNDDRQRAPNGGKVGTTTAVAFLRRAAATYGWTGFFSVLRCRQRPRGFGGGKPVAGVKINLAERREVAALIGNGRRDWKRRLEMAAGVGE